MEIASLTSKSLAVRIGETAACSTNVIVNGIEDAITTPIFIKSQAQEIVHEARGLRDSERVDELDGTCRRISARPIS